MNIVSKISFYLNVFGISPKRFINAAKGLSHYLRNKSKLKRQILKSAGSFQITKSYPCLYDRFDTAGSIPGHYFHQDIYAASKILKNNPQKHVDVGSRIDGFVAHVASFREIEIVDIREFNDKIKNVNFIKADIMADSFSLINYCDSLSCLHSIEHFGLGRYGDNVDLNGHIKGFDNLQKILKPGGRFYFSTVIGPQRIEFDAHRVFSLRYLLDMIIQSFRIHSFAYINDLNELIENAELNDKDISSNFNCNYGCGIFELTKL